MAEWFVGFKIHLDCLKSFYRLIVNTYHV